MTEEQRRQTGCPAWECLAYLSDRTLAFAVLELDGANDVTCAASISVQTVAQLFRSGS